MSLAAAALFSALALAPGARAASGRVAVVAESSDRLGEPLLRELKKGSYTLVSFDRSDVGDPIKRGELLARLSANDLLVTIGDPATTLVLDELEDARVYFVGAAIVSGEHLASKDVAGILSYNVDRLLDGVQALGFKRLGYALTPGYERLASAIRAGAAARGLSLEERKVASQRDVPGAVGELMSRSQAVWLAGDPRLARGASFQFSVERSLARKVPLVVAGPWGVQRGGFLACEPSGEALAPAAAAAIRTLAGGGRLPESERIRTAPGGGLVYNAALAERWSLKIPSGRWTPLR